MQADLSKLIRFHTELNPRLWQNNNLRREVEYKLLQIAKEFVKFINIDNLMLEDITISGSNCSYNYNDQSDIDLHLVVSSDSPCWPHLQELYLAKKSLFNDQHDIKIRDIDVEVYVQDSKQPHISNGIYSLLKDAWIKQPKMITADVDETNAEHKYKSLRFQIQIAVASEDLVKIRAMQDKVKKIRQSGLEKNGEFGPENLAFKMLRNDGTLDELYAAGAEAEDKRLSLPETEVSEKINPEITQKDFRATKNITIDGVGPLTLSAKNLSTSRPPEFLVNVTNEAGKNIGYFRFIVKDYDPDKRNIFGFRVKSKLDPHVIGGNISVWSEFQKKGIATAVYQFVKELGNDIKPSTTQTDAGKSMWRSFNRQSEVAESQALNELNIVQTLKFIQQAHGDQLYGELPYWKHPRAVAMTGKRIFGASFSSDAAKVAFLHDVVEDTSVSLADLNKLDFSPEVIEAVGLLTKNKSLTYSQNIEQIINSGNELAMMVKYADNYENYSGDKSNWDPNRAASLEKKYRKSMNMLAAKLGVNAHVDENFADGKGPGRPGDSQRHGIPKGATIAQLEKASHAKGRKGQLARWQLNMRRGHKKESVDETRDAAFAWIKSKLPKWPDYVLRDWIYNSVRGDFGPESVHTEQHLRTVLAGEGMDDDTQWQLVPNFKFSFQTLNPWTVDKIKARWGGESDMGMGIPKDAERHATQAALAQQQGGIRKEPVILKKVGNQYELIEGWHRTIQHFKQFPNGYTGPAWVATNARPVSEAAESVVAEKWSQKYKRSIDCSHPKGFSQKAHCAGRKKTNEVTNMTPQALRTHMNKLMNDDQKYTDPTQRTNWQDGIWRFITANQAAIFADKGDKGNGDYPAAPYAAWLLVQHMDAHPERQREFYIKLSKALPNHPKLQFLKDRSAVNAWILKNANNPEYYHDGKPLPSPTINVRNPAMFKDASVKATSREQALRNAEQAGNKLLVAAVKATNAQTQPSYTQQTESVTETKNTNSLIREPFKNPVGVLKKYLDKMESPTWDKIDLLMKRIANRQGIGADLLHKMWVDKYNKTPDTYCGIKKKKVDTKA